MCSPFRWFLYVSARGAGGEARGQARDGKRALRPSVRAPQWLPFATPDHGSRGRGATAQPAIGGCLVQQADPAIRRPCATTTRPASHGYCGDNNGSRASGLGAWWRWRAMGGRLPCGSSARQTRRRPWAALVRQQQSPRPLCTTSGLTRWCGSSASPWLQVRGGRGNTPVGAGRSSRRPSTSFVACGNSPALPVLADSWPDPLGQSSKSLAVSPSTRVGARARPWRTGSPSRRLWGCWCQFWSPG